MTEKTKSILLVDDNLTVRRGLRQMFESAGFVCSESENGAEAVECVEQLKPDLIVLDFSMPVMNGLQAAPLLKKKLPNAPIIMFTMFVSQQLTEIAIAAGVAVVVAKDQAATHLVSQAKSLLKIPFDAG
ncbi:MAG TPA: response regulator transcription factor [Candidatus Sulfotelmatobacter sp.]|nr:response regulator transcription factor [Candidatus Sulfotelmatobacter sp.]